MCATSRCSSIRNLTPGAGVAFDVVIRGIRRAQLEAERILGIKSQLIMCFLRDWSAEFAMTTLVQSLPYREWIIGVGLDSDEKNNPPVKFKAVFERARQRRIFPDHALRRRSAELDRTYPASAGGDRRRPHRSRRQRVG